MLGKGITTAIIWLSVPLTAYVVDNELAFVGFVMAFFATAVVWERQ